jgi:hypothetical protein
MSFEWPITELTDEEVRNLIQYADSIGYPRDGRELILPAKKVLVGEVYGIKVYRGPAPVQVPFMQCSHEVIDVFGTEVL